MTKTAKDMLAASRNGQAKIDRQARAAAAARVREDRSRLAWAICNLLPEYRRGLEKAIESAAADGRTNASFYIPHAAEPDLAKIMIEELRTRGFTCTYQIHHHEETVDSPGGASTDIRVDWSKP